jgi:hypothetical protein
MSAATQVTGEEFVDAMYDYVLADTGTALEFRIFDPQNCEHLDIEWLAGAVEKDGITRAEVDGMIADGLLKRWKTPSGKEGFLLYSERQALTAKKIRDSGRYSAEEIQHIFNDWNTYIEVLVIGIDPVYDSFAIDDHEHFRRRAGEMIQFFEEALRDIDNGSGYSFPNPEVKEQQRKRAQAQVRAWKWWYGKVASTPEDKLPPEIQSAWRRQLFHLRWRDEYVRFTISDQFLAQIEQGYGVDVTFNGYEWSGGTTTLKDISWTSTLRRFKDTRNEGKAIPLRTPDFNVTERGIEFLKTPTPDEYVALHEKYRLAELSTLLEEIGPSLWKCDLAASGRGECAECKGIFERTKAARKFCSDRCRNNSKARRWRESNPERARMAQAKHYKEAYPDPE